MLHQVKGALCMLRELACAIFERATSKVIGDFGLRISNPQSAIRNHPLPLALAPWPSTQPPRPLQGRSVRLQCRISLGSGSACRKLATALRTVFLRQAH